ncbi:hypothetical protein BKA69DRAFT_697645 [Paraphysoderma sedebokerense]|nr:hypothetical protein BKA69DRAFT_697645 [Paraphysoderma sedebokerense]
MSEKTPIAQTSPEFAYLEYFLQLSLQASTARVSAAYALSNPHVTIQFERRCKDILTLDTWIDHANLPSQNGEEEIIRRGFQFNPQSPGMKVGIGAFKLPKDRQNQTKNLRKAILCKVGIGRSYVNDEERAQNDQLPDGYDSWYLPVRDSQKTADDYYHEYFINNAAQILPMYLVVFEYDPVKERKSREKPYCDNCENAFAEVHCAADNANLCKNCDMQIHSANKLMSRHVRTPIGKGSDIFGNCRHHPEKLYEFFCSQCHVPVCVFCKMVGHHSSGEAAKHKLVSVAEAYQSVLQEAGVSDTILQSRRNSIVNQIACINSRAKSVEKHATQIHQQIEEIYRRAINELKLITKKKLDVLLGDELELKRQLGEINRLEEFLKYQQTGDATHFLFSWARHQQLRQELHEFRFFRDVIDVHLDIKV